MWETEVTAQEDATTRAIMAATFLRVGEQAVLCGRRHGDRNARLLPGSIRTRRLWRRVKYGTTEHARVGFGMAEAR